LREADKYLEVGNVTDDGTNVSGQPKDAGLPQQRLNLGAVEKNIDRAYIESATCRRSTIMRSGDSLVCAAFLVGWMQVGDDGSDLAVIWQPRKKRDSGC